MSARSNRATVSQHNTLHEGNATVVQIVGDGNIVNSCDFHLQLTLHRNCRIVRRELDWLSPYSCPIPWVGRKSEFDSLCKFLKRPQRVLARVVFGPAGRGKTRLALELCEWATSNGWTAGFASTADLSR